MVKPEIGLERLKGIKALCGVAVWTPMLSEPPLAPLISLRMLFLSSIEPIVFVNHRTESAHDK